MIDTDTIEDTGNAGGFRHPPAILASTHDDCDAATLLDTMITGAFAGRIALVSSFGVEVAVLLDLVAQIDRHTPVIFIDSGKLFSETFGLPRPVGRTLRPHHHSNHWARCGIRVFAGQRRKPVGARSGRLLRPTQGGSYGGGIGRLRRLDIRA